MPGSPLVRYHVAQVVIKDIYHLIIGYGLAVLMTKHIRCLNLVLNISPQMVRFIARPRSLLDIFKLVSNALHSIRVDIAYLEPFFGAKGAARQRSYRRIEYGKSP